MSCDSSPPCNKHYNGMTSSADFRVKMARVQLSLHTAIKYHHIYLHIEIYYLRKKNPNILFLNLIHFLYLYREFPFLKEIDKVNIKMTTFTVKPTLLFKLQSETKNKSTFDFFLNFLLLQSKSNCKNSYFELKIFKVLYLIMKHIPHINQLDINVLVSNNL